MNIPTMDELTKEWATQALVGEPFGNAPGTKMVHNCYSVAVVLAKMLGGVARPVYGQYAGKSVLRETPMHRHGWVQVRRGIIDPTRFAFEGVDPYIWTGGIRGDDWFYDEGGWTFSGDWNRVPPPRGDEKLKKMKWDKNTAKAISDIVFGDGRNCMKLTVPEIWIVAHTPPPKLGVLLAPTYKGLKAGGHMAMVGEDAKRFHTFVMEHGWDGIREIDDGDDEDY